MEQEQPQAKQVQNKQAWFKKHQELVIRVSIFILGLAIGFGLHWLISNNFFINQNSEPAQETTAQNEYVLNKQVSAYIVWWDQDRGFASLQANKDKISTIHPVWYKIKADGTVQKFTGAENLSIINFAKDNNIKIIPTFTNDCDPAASETVMQNTTLVAEHIALIDKLVTDNNYDGVDIDYECLSGESLKSAYSSFLTELSQALHQNDKLLTTAVHQKADDIGTWDGPAAQDWKVINQVCDQILIMAYDYHWATSEAGNIAPLDWMSSSLDYAKGVLDLNKTYLGIHFYAYDWVDKQATDLTYSDVSNLITAYSSTINLSAENEKYFDYSVDGQNHTVYFADKDVILPRIKLANEYGIAGIGIWRIGNEDPANWQAIYNTFTTQN